MSDANTTKVWVTASLYVTMSRELGQLYPGRAVGPGFDQIMKKLGEAEALYAALPLMPKPQPPEAKP